MKEALYVVGWVVAVVLSIASLESCTAEQLQTVRDIETGLDKGTAACVRLYSCLGVQQAAEKCGLAHSIVEGAMAAQNVICPVPDRDAGGQ
jgi:hypothetical protein